MSWMAHSPEPLALDLALRGTALLLFGWALITLGRRTSGRMRHRLWCGVFLGLLGLPLLSFALPTWTLDLPQWLHTEELRGPAPLSPNQAVDISPEGTTPSLQPAQPVSPSTRTPVRELATGTVLFYLWIFGTSLFLLRFLVLLGRSVSAFRRGLGVDGNWHDLLQETTSRLGLRRRVRLVENSAIQTPMTGGFLRPVVLLPVAARQWCEERRRLVLLHELVHVQRGDWLFQMIAQTVCALHWWNPLAWMGRSRLEQERELACDETVLALGTRASHYASHLLAIAEEAQRRTQPPIATVAMARTSKLEGRLMSILEPSKPSRRLATTASLTLGLLAMVCLVSTFEPTPLSADPASQDDDSTSTKTSKSSHSSWHGSWTTNSDFGDLQWTSRGEGEVVFDGEEPVLGPDSRLEVETVVDGHRVRFELVTDELEQARETLWVDGEERSLEDGQRFRQAALAILATHNKLGSLRGQVGALRGQIGALRGQEGALRGQIGALRGQQGALKGQIGALAGHRGALKAKMGALRSEAGAMKAKVGAMRSEIARMEAKFRALVDSGASSEEVARFKAQREAMVAEIEAAQKRIQNFDVSQHEEEVRRQIEALAKEEEALRLQAEQAAADVESTISDLEAQIADLAVGEEVAALQDRILGLDVESRSKKMQDQLEARVQELRQAIQALLR